MIENIWLSNEIFNSYASVGIAKFTDEDKWRRSYEIWEHAFELISNPMNDFSLADGIANLKRSLNHRLLLIEDLYHFKDIYFPNKPKGYLELLEDYGIVRPFIRKELLKIRNEIEHNDQKPPELYRCQELTDIVWYFLKSTDGIVQSVKYHVDFIINEINGGETFFRYTIELDWINHYNLRIHGLFPEKYISYEKKDGFIEVVKADDEQILYESFDDVGKRIEGKCLLDKESYHDLLKEIFMYAK